MTDTIETVVTPSGDFDKNCLSVENDDLYALMDFMLARFPYFQSFQIEFKEGALHAIHISHLPEQEIEVKAINKALKDFAKIGMEND